jgi:pimeloyl-ACP methyl ester carboxylesterase
MSVALILAAVAAASARIAVHDRPLDPAPYQTLWFDQTLDHFRYDGKSQQTWKQRYLLNDQHWDRASGPILFYSGNEGPIDAFYAASGFITEVLAPKLQALLVFAEERYYGESKPFGAGSWTPEALSFLSTEQVLADYANLLITLKPTWNASGRPVVSFGGSYGGTLSTLFRIKYPHVVVGALAASAPLGYYSPSFWGERGVDEHTWFQTVVDDYTAARPGCYSTLVRAVGTPRSYLRDRGLLVISARLYL